MLIPLADIGVDGVDLNLEIKLAAGKVCRIEGDVGGDFIELPMYFEKI